ncbi:ABC transporter permease [Pseudoroseomonas cervicalis]|uniref:ABC transporter permease n=1 Tax=Teichococcus cervicalis TaxID=204525 RepID=UPI0027828731|nr:ABC transporter permease [Pseudoroseomonas cervicalis]MDQ1081217.1 capsular polysaccharide transport system permease protein [Pseudoroseomonas cervicalis]
MDIPRREPSGLVATQFRVIGALFMRELLTRFGTSRIGYVWLIGEPMMLAIAISTLHAVSGHGLGNGLPVFLFYAMGYTPFVMFRSIVNRGANVIEANMSLLYHRNITLLDIAIARNVMEAAVCSMIITLFMIAAVLIFDEWPHEPALFYFGLMLSALLAHGLSMLLAGLQVFIDGLDRFTHPMTYLMMPISATFYMLSSLPTEARELLLWNPLVSVHEMNRWAMFGDRVQPYYDIPYVLCWIIGLNVLGMAALRAARSRLTLME